MALLAAATSMPAPGLSRRAQDVDGPVAQLIAALVDAPETAPDCVSRGSRDAVEVLFASLELGQLVDQEGAVLSGLDDSRRSAIMACLERVDPRMLRSHLRARVEESLAARAATLEVLEGLGDGRDLRLALDAAVLAGKPLDEDLLDRLFVTVAGIHGRDEEAAGVLQSLILTEDTPIANVLVEAVGSVNRARSIETLAFALGYRSELEARLLRVIGELGWHRIAPVDEHVLALIRPYVLSSEAALARDGVLAAGKLDDHGALADLITLLDHDDEALRENAVWSLEQISQLRFSSIDRWSQWIRSEQEWFERDAPSLFDDLRGDDLGRTVRALRLLAQHRYRRDATAVRVARLLDHQDPMRRRLACITLSQVGSAAAVPPLVDRLEDEAESVRDAAHAALRRLTGLGLASDVTLWREALGSGSG